MSEVRGAFGNHPILYSRTPMFDRALKRGNWQVERECRRHGWRFHKNEKCPDCAKETKCPTCHRPYPKEAARE